MIGYPGTDAVIVGARGFYRATVTLYGVGAHSGRSTPGGQNAVEKAALLVNALCAHQLPAATTPEFSLSPTLTVTGVSGGSGFSIVPDSCRVMVDIRLTPGFAADDARELLRGMVNDIDDRRPGRARAHIEEAESWPAYRLDEGSHVATALLSAARRHHDAATPSRVCGPSNIGNFFSAHGIDATCGFGVGYEGLHAPNERIEIDTIPIVYRVYRDAIRKLLQPGGPHDGEARETRTS
jgi:succinyl-diaminopimelate desuccinylase